MVINVGALKSGDHDAVQADIQKVVRASHQARRHRESDSRNRAAHRPRKDARLALAKQAGADFVKTSTGFSTAGATAHDIA